MRPEYRGAASKAWIDGAIAKYRPVADVTDLAKVGERTIATARVSGSFPGSPAQIRYKFTLKNGKIAHWPLEHEPSDHNA
jgi:hypothetical protein